MEQMRHVFQSEKDEGREEQGEVVIGKSKAQMISIGSAGSSQWPITIAGFCKDNIPCGNNEQALVGATRHQVLTILLYMTLIAMSSAYPEMARNFETKQYAHNQGPLRRPTPTTPTAMPR